jgi:hypothetical protein
MLVYGYQSIDMLCIVSYIKFDGGLFISVLKNEQLFTKKIGAQNRAVKKSSNLPVISKKDRPSSWQKAHLDLNFLANGIDNPSSNLT